MTSHKESKRVLITGASGFIGGYLVKEALSRGFEVYAGVRASSNKSNLQDERITFIDLKYNDPEAMARQLSSYMEDYGPFDYVIHNAGLTKTLNKQDFFRVNAENTNNFLKALALLDNKPRKFLLMSSLSTFGLGDEDNFTPIKLDDPQEPQTEYGKSKLQAEQYLRNQDAFPYIILRPTGVYGPGDKDYYVEMKSIKNGLDFALGSVPQHITFIYVKDLARAAFMALENPDIINKEYFVSDGDVHTDDGFARMIKYILNKKFLLRARVPNGLAYVACLCSEGIGRLIGKAMTLNTDKYKILKQRNWTCDVAPLQDEVGFVADYPLRGGLEETITWYKENRWL